MTGWKATVARLLWLEFETEVQNIGPNRTDFFIQFSVFQGCLKGHRGTCVCSEQSFAKRAEANTPGRLLCEKTTLCSVGAAVKQSDVKCFMVALLA